MNATVTVGNLTVTVKNRCNRIDPMPVGINLGGVQSSTFFCTKCGRDLERTNYGNGWTHGSSTYALTRFAFSGVGK